MQRYKQFPYMLIPIFDQKITYVDINHNKEANLIHESSIGQHNEKNET